MYKLGRLFKFILISFSFVHSLDIHVIGDSHANCSFADKESRELWSGLTYSFIYYYDQHSCNFHIHWMPDKTMNRVGRDNFDFLDFNQLEINSKDIVVFVFGEIDVRCHVKRQSEKQSKSIEEIVTLLATNYVETILNYKRSINFIPVVFGVIPPPIKDYLNPEVPFYGSTKERAKITIILNSQLKRLCYERNILFLNINDQFCFRGRLKPDLSDGVHIKIEYNDIVKHKLLELLIANKVL